MLRTGRPPLRSFLRTRRLLADERGLSLTELLISMTIFSILMGIVMSVMITLTNMSRDSVARTQAIQEARLGLSQIDRQVRSGNVILDPADEDPDDSGVPPFFSMRIHTQAGGVATCAQWRVIDHDSDTFGDLEFRTWTPGLPLTATPWSPVAHNLISMDVAPASAADIDVDDPETWPPFWVNSEASGNTEAQYVSITLRLKDPGEKNDSKPTSISTTITGRNTVFSVPSTACSPVPTP